MEHTVSQVEFPAMRREVMYALAALADAEYQQRVWIQRIYPREDFYDDFDAQIHSLYDDNGVLPDPASSVGAVLLSGDEIARLHALGDVLDPMLDELGDASDAAYLAHPHWPAVVDAAGKALAAMVRGGGFEER